MPGPEKARPPLFPGNDQPDVEILVREYLKRAADKWTMLILDTLEQNGVQRFFELQAAIPGVSSKMLTKTLKQMERDGLVIRTAFAEIPPRVEYHLTDLGRGLGTALCGVWLWIQDNFASLHLARTSYWKKKRQAQS